MAQSTIQSTTADRLGFVLFPLGCLAAGFVIGQVTDTGETSWFQQLTRPTYQPPDWAFPVAWTLLYLLMGLAAWRVWRKLGWAYGRGLLILFAAQLVLNLAWTPVFFAGQSIIGGLIVIVPLLILVAATTVAFRMVDALAGLLMTPYMLWVAFACLLNVHIYILN